MSRTLPGSFPAQDALAVTQSDTADDPAGPFRGFILSAEGALKIRTANDEDRTYASGIFAAKTIYPIAFKRVFDTGTDAITVIGLI